MAYILKSNGELGYINFENILKKEILGVNLYFEVSLNKIVEILSMNWFDSCQGTILFRLNNKFYMCTI